MSWVRPADVPLGTVWRRFKGKQRNGITPSNYQVRDMSPQEHDQCLQIMKETFIRDEPLAQALDLGSDPVSINSVMKTWEKYLKQHISLSCFAENDKGEPQELVGFNILMMKSVDDPQEDLDKIEGNTWRNILSVLVAAEETCNVLEHYGVQRYLSSSGLVVSPNHRGQNIGAEIIKSREPLCKALGVEATATVFTAAASQALAAKCGYELLGEVDYSSMSKNGVDIKNCSTPSAKLMGIKYEF